MLNHTISEYTKFINKIDRLTSQQKKHDCRLFYANGKFLKQGTDFQHNFNKVNIRKDARLPKNFSGIKKKVYIGRKKKERKEMKKANHGRKSSSSIQRLCSISFANELPQCPGYPSSAPVPETCINIEAIWTLSQRYASIANKSLATCKSQCVLTLFFYIQKSIHNK